MFEKIKKEVYSWIIVIAVVLILRAIFVEAYVIPTGSMEDTLLIGDALLVNKFIYGVKLPFTEITLIPGNNPKRGEIVVFKYPFENKDFVKRCVAIEGDTVEIKNKKLYINNEYVEENYVYHKDNRIFQSYPIDENLFQNRWEKGELEEYVPYPVSLRDNFGPVVVPNRCIFTMGDNRDNSKDSRFWGPLHLKYLKGRPLFIYFSFDPGGEAQNLFDIMKFWHWKKIRLVRIGKIV